MTAKRIIRSGLFVAAAVVLFPALPGAAKPIQDKATSSIEIDFPDGVMRVETRTSSFTVASYWPEGAADPVHVLLQERVDIARRADAEGPESATVALVAWRVDEDAELTSLFEIEADGEDARIESLAGSDAYVAVTRFGCCGALEATKLFSLENGALLMEYTGDPAWLEVPNSRGLVRLVGIDTAWSASANPRFGVDPSLVAILSYASRTAGMRRVAIRLTGGTIDAIMSVPELVFTAAGAEPDPHFVLWPADGQTNPRAITDVAVQVTFTPEHVAIIPILADEPDLAHATLTGGLAVSLLPAE